MSAHIEAPEPTSDLKKLKEMLDRVKISYTEETFVRSNSATTLTVERGYTGFATSFEFDAAGMLVDMGAYE